MLEGVLPLVMVVVVWLGVVPYEDGGRLRELVEISEKVHDAPESIVVFPL